MGGGDWELMSLETPTSEEKLTAFLEGVFPDRVLVLAEGNRVVFGLSGTGSF